jgi:hypothetical protein
MTFGMPLPEREAVEGRIFKTGVRRQKRKPSRAIALSLSGMIIEELKKSEIIILATQP